MNEYSDKTIPTETEVGKLESSGPAVRLTPKALEMVKRMREKEGRSPQTALRVAVVGGGCSGFQYSLSFDEQRNPNDLVISYEGLDVLVDEFSRQYLEGVTVDFVDGLYGAGFKFNNPRAARTCGCGSSFSV